MLVCYVLEGNWWLIWIMVSSKTVKVKCRHEYFLRKNQDSPGFMACGLL
jgi:hypothetical protein